MQNDSTKMDIDPPLKNDKFISKIKCPKCYEIPLFSFKTNEYYKINVDLLCPNNHFFEYSLNEFLNNSNKTTELKCSDCNKNNLNLNEIFYCKNCNKTICSNCILNHFDHLKLSLDKINNYCFNHNENLFEYYCENCKKNLCEKCLNDHNEHKYTIRKLNKNFDDDDRTNNNNDILILEKSIKEIFNKKERVINLLKKLINKINEDYKIYKKNIENQIILNKELFSLFDEGFKNNEICENLRKFSDFISKKEIYYNINDNLDNLTECFKNLKGYEEINIDESDESDEEDDVIKTFDSYDDVPFNKCPIDLKIQDDDFPEKISFIRGSLSDSFCLFTSRKNENLIVYYNFIDEYSNIVIYNLVTKNKKIIEKICKTEITGLKHFIRNNKDILLITTLENTLIVYNITYNKQELKIQVIEKEEKNNENNNNNEEDEKYSFSYKENNSEKNNESKISEKNNNNNNIEKKEDDNNKKINKKERIYNPNYYKNLINEECIMLSCYLNGVIKIYNFKGENIKNYELNGFDHLCFYMIYKYKDVDYIIANDWKGIASYNFKNQTLFNIYKRTYGIAAYNCKIIDIFGVTNLIFGFDNSIYFYDFETGKLIKQLILSYFVIIRNVIFWNNDYIIINDEKSNYVFCIDIKKKQFKKKYNISDENNLACFCSLKKMKIGKNEYLYLQYSNQDNLRIMKIPDFDDNEDNFLY